MTVRSTRPTRLIRVAASSTGICSFDGVWSLIADAHRRVGRQWIGGRDHSFGTTTPLGLVLTLATPATIDCTLGSDWGAKCVNYRMTCRLLNALVSMFR